MARVKKENNATIPDSRAAETGNNPDLVTEHEQPVKRKGRPKGSVDKTKRKQRTDVPNKVMLTEPGDNSRMIQYAMALSELPKIDFNNPQEVKTRINEFFSICVAYDFKPSIAALASSFGISRTTLFLWLTGKIDKIHNNESLNAIKNAYDTINSLYELYMNNGKINPVAGIFLMKNNMGYKDTTDYTISTNQEQNITLSDIVNRSGLLE